MDGLSVVFKVSIYGQATYTTISSQPGYPGHRHPRTTFAYHPHWVTQALSLFRFRFLGLTGGGVGTLTGAGGLRLALSTRSLSRASRSILSSHSSQAGSLLHFFPPVSHKATKIGGKSKSMADR